MRAAMVGQYFWVPLPGLRKKNLSNMVYYKYDYQSVSLSLSWLCATLIAVAINTWSLSSWVYFNPLYKQFNETLFVSLFVQKFLLRYCHYHWLNVDHLRVRTYVPLHSAKLLCGLCALIIIVFRLRAAIENYKGCTLLCGVTGVAHI